MAISTDVTEPLSRPDCMVRLGLLPPYSEEDVHRAYREKAKTAHPDRGGEAADFNKLQEAYEQGLEVARFHTNRRGWLGARVEEYLRRDSAIAEIERCGGRVELEAIPWLRRDLGEDFAQITDKLIGIHLTGPAVDDAALERILEHRASLATVTDLNLSQSRITDAILPRLRDLTGLRRLDLRGTPITHRGLLGLLPMPDLERVEVSGTRIGAFGRLRLRWVAPGVVR